MTEPARKATLKASIHALPPAAITVVRALENTATFMPISPQIVQQGQAARFRGSLTFM
jgi:hypothetical protein